MARVSRSAAPPLRVGLVLGGGGTIGAAYHAGVLAALAQDLGWDARGADIIVGTSAGSLVGGLLRAGVSAEDLAAMAVGAAANGAPVSVIQAMSERPEFPPFTYRHLLRPPRVLGPSAVAGLGVLTIRRGPAGVTSLAMLLPDGHVSLAPHVAFFDDLFDGSWPDEGLLICATRRRDCRRTVFGNGARQASLSEAVAASCAVPGYFAGVRIDGHTYVDGGVVSATNADVLRRHDLDLAVVVSPMSGRGRGRSLGSAVRELCSRALRREMALLARRGIPAVVIEPGPEVLSHVTADFMSEAALAQIVRCAFLETGEQILGDDGLRQLAVGDRSDAA